MWYDYFPQGMIFGIDNCSIEGDTITPESVKQLERDRIKTFIGDQSNREHLKTFIEEYGDGFYTIIDDGLHFQKHQQISLGFLFPYIKPKGIYVIEDLCPSNRTKVGWGLKDFVNFSDNTTKILEDFIKIKKITSPYMIEEEMAYLNQNIEEVKIYQVDEESIIAFIKKR